MVYESAFLKTSQAMQSPKHVTKKLINSFPERLAWGVNISIITMVKDWILTGQSGMPYSIKTLCEVYTNYSLYIFNQLPDSCSVCIVYLIMFMYFM